MLAKSDMFVTLRNDGPSMHERDEHDRAWRWQQAFDD
jgi:hypothetical protein